MVPILFCGPQHTFPIGLSPGPTSPMKQCLSLPWGGPFWFCTFIGVYCFVHTSLWTEKKKKNNQSPYSKFILALIPAILSVPPLSLLCITLFISTTRSQTPQQKITQFLSTLNQLPQPPCALIRGLPIIAAQGLGKKKIRKKRNIFPASHSFLHSYQFVIIYLLIFLHIDCSPFPQAISLIKAGKCVCFVDQGMPNAGQSKHV